MNQEPQLLQRLKAIRRRALLIAEYLMFSRVQQSQGAIAATSQEQWRYDVRRIELYIMDEEAPHLTSCLLDDFQPLGIFFHEVHTGVEHVATYVPPQN